MNRLRVLVLSEDRDDSRPSAADIIPVVEDLTIIRIDVRIRLQPTRQATAAAARRTVDQIAEEEAFVRVTAATIQCASAATAYNV